MTSTSDATSQAAAAALLDTVEWQPSQPTAEAPTTAAPGQLYATHHGVMDLGGIKLRCYRLNDGRAVFNADDVNAFFAAALDTGSAA